MVAGAAEQTRAGRPDADRTAELRRRYHADAGLLSAAFAAGAAHGPVPRVQAGLSDPHAHGRTVAVVEFAAEGRAVYKPRSLRTDAAFAKFLEWLSAAAPQLPPLRAVRTLDRGAYGWAEYVERAPCADAGAVARYYERCGALLAVAYVLRIGDLHSENVVPAGEHPLLIDLEAALTPVLRRVGTPGAVEEATVLNTSLLPMAYVDAAERGYVEGGIVGSRECLTGGSEEAGPAVARGFDRAYRAMQRHRAALLARGGPLAGFSGARVRLVLRATTVYATLLRRLAAPDRASDAAARAAELDRLARPFRGRPEWASMLPAFAAEARALARGDVPRFELAAGGTALRADGRVVVPGYAALSGLAAVRRRVRALGDADRRRQLQYVRLAFAADAHRRAWPHAAPADGGTPADTGPRDADPPLAPADALAEARRLGALVVALADRPRGGRGARWQVCDPAAAAPTLRPLDASLGHGQSGVGLLLAALHACSDPAGPDGARPDGARPDGAREGSPVGLPDWAAWARLALAPVCAAVGRGRRLGRLGAAGLASGAGGVAFALARSAAWLDDRELRAGGEAAAQVAARAAGASAPADAGTPGSVDYDVFGGMAGAVQGLLAVYEQTRDAAALDWAARAGDELADSLAREWAPRRRRCRHAPDRQESSGFGFGAPGRAAVLLRLAAHTGDRDHARAAARTLTAAASGMADRLALGADAAGPHAGGWCRGDVGVAHALAAALATGTPDEDEAARWRAALGRAASAIAEASGARARVPYALCCGAFARVELLLEAGEVLNDAELGVAARRLAYVAVARAARRLAYHAVPYAEPLAPALFGGLAGVAYTLLRVARPDVVPSVLRGAAAPGPMEAALY